VTDVDEGIRERMRFLGCEIDSLTMDETLARVIGLVESGQPTQHVVVNAAKVVAMHDDPRLRGIVNDCAVVNADGQAVVWASRLLGQPLPERVAGVDLFEHLLAEAESRNYRVFFLGATQAALDSMLARLSLRHPKLIVAGSRNGYFDDGENSDVVASVRESGSHLLFVGVPSPRKEYWLAANLREMGVPFAMGVGGSFDVLAGHARRAPQWMQRAGLEWAYRLAQEPRRMWRRYIVGNARFVGLVAREAFRPGQDEGG
jgi:N-acetylglucosaminyldiphosphoundecaprenol N-acetyl-beta-D-mannosaminyltransferase